MNFSDKAISKQLIEKCRKGDEKSQEILFKAFYGKMLAACYRYAENMDEAKDLVQEGFIKVFNKLSYDQKGSLEGWIRRVIVNNAIDHVRKKKHYFSEYRDELLDNKEDEITNEKELENYQRIKAKVMMKLIQKLSPAYKMVFNLYVLEDYSHKEIAKKLTISEGTSKSNLAKAKMNLKKMFDEYLKTNDIDDEIEF